jgi:hypothetical protein
MERTAKVIDKQNPLYGMLCTVGPLVEQSDVHYITAVDEPWHSSYARDSQLEFEETLVSILIDHVELSENQEADIREGSEIRKQKI